MSPQPDPFSPSTTTILRTSLIDSITANGTLKSRLEQMPADEKTIEYFQPDASDLTHPDWSGFANQASSHSETLDFSFDETPANRMAGEKVADAGFVPIRNIANLGVSHEGDIDYRIVGKLGAGGTGIVYQAHQRAVDREVAIKMLREELARNASSRQRFLAEARVIGGLDHPNVIALHEVYTDAEGALFYSMKRIDGTSWDKQIGEFNQAKNLETLLRVADAIRYAHSRGLIHRDIKPENVMLGKYGEVLLADWGLAINHNLGESTADAHISIGGTPAYMAPELATAAAGKISFATDVYLLGAILYQIVTGRPPHAGDTLLECIHAAANNIIVPTDIEGELVDIALTAMATAPADRYENVDAFIAAIKAHDEHQESVRLVRRAIEQAGRGEANDEQSSRDPYRNFAVADALLSEAIDIWPGNVKAHRTRKRLQLELAAIAADRGDYELAWNLYEAAGEAESDEAVMVQFHRMRRNASQQQVSRYSALFTQAPDAGLLVQIKTAKIVEANQAFGRLFGYTEDQVLGKRINELNLWACPERRRLMIEAVENNDQVDDFEASFLHKDGRVIEVLIGARAVEVQGERMLVTTIRDISLRKKAENELKQSRARLRDLQRMAGLATWSFDVETGKATWNTEAFELAGRPRDQGAPTREEYFEMIHPDDRNRLHRALDAAIDSGAAYELSVRQRSGDGTYRHVLVRGQPIIDDNGKTIEVYGIVLERPQRSVERDA